MHSERQEVGLRAGARVGRLEHRARDRAAGHDDREAAPDQPPQGIDHRRWHVATARRSDDEPVGAARETFDDGQHRRRAPPRRARRGGPAPAVRRHSRRTPGAPRCAPGPPSPRRPDRAPQLGQGATRAVCCLATKRARSISSWITTTGPRGVAFASHATAKAARRLAGPSLPGCFGGAHRSGEDDGNLGSHLQRQRVRRLLYGIGSLRDHDSVVGALRVAHEAGQLRDVRGTDADAARARDVDDRDRRHLVDRRRGVHDLRAGGARHLAPAGARSAAG